ncbi:uncharacterized protein TNCT_644091 [Trichonephila clavata]|uniref:Uncharacterized protein n=1 Tax=Trichonephila clavata TaxID=2740835 RepID=A0A8X6L932_TRICU|nr:uncharacterized protein TNCT_644091 [Trichonephila clavata]
MRENVSHVFVHHHHDDSSNIKIYNMTCCIVLSVVIVLLLLFILAFLVYIAVVRPRRQTQSPTRPPNLLETLRNPSRAMSNSFKEDLPNRRTLSNTYPSLDDNLINFNPNRPNIPMATFRPDVADRRPDSSNSSSGGLREFLFPPRHDGEIIYERPKVVAYAGQVFAASGIHTRTHSYPEQKASRSETTGRNSDSVNTSLEWDYFEPRRRCASSDPTNATGFDGRKTVNVCWV